MRETLGLFWRKAWDNLFHIVILNMIWLTLAIPFILAVVLTVNSLVPRDVMAAAARETSTARAAGPAVESTAAVPATESTAPTAGGARAAPFRLEWTPRALPAIVFLIASWLVVCIATGFVYYATADIVAYYDFSGYKDVLRTYLRRGPILRSVVVITLSVVTFAATWANIAFYLRLAQNYGLPLLLLAGVMLWFLILAAMTFTLAMPLVAQRNMGLGRTLKTAAVLALGAPGRTFVVMLVGFVIFVLGVLSGAGAGFFAVSAPAMLFNADAKLRLDKIEGGGAKPEGPQA